VGTTSHRVDSIVPALAKAQGRGTHSSVTGRKIRTEGRATRPVSEQHSYKPKDGFVPNEKTAIRIAEAVLTPIYGEKQIKSEEPFSAKLHDGVWTVEGSIAGCARRGTRC